MSESVITVESDGLECGIMRREEWGSIIGEGVVRGIVSRERRMMWLRMVWKYGIVNGDW